MLKNTDLRPDQLKRVETALRKSARLKDLIDTFYDLSLLESEQIEPRWEKTNLSSLLIDFLSENAPLFEPRHIKPQITLPEASVFVLADRSMLDPILQNLVTNDNPEKLDVSRLFERFYMGDSSRSTESSDLGLSVVRLLPEKLRGSVNASVCGSILCIAVTLKAVSEH